MAAARTAGASATVAHDRGAPSSVRKDGDTLVFAGALDRAAVAALWRPLQSLRRGLRRIDLAAVSHVDSAGLALLAELVSHGEVGNGIAVIGAPPGLTELRSAYRLDDKLRFAS